jgi:hypothetical protein
VAEVPHGRINGPIDVHEVIYRAPVLIARQVERRDVPAQGHPSPRWQTAAHIAELKLMVRRGTYAWTETKVASTAARK